MRSLNTRRSSLAAVSRTYSTLPVIIGANTFSISSTCSWIGVEPGQHRRQLVEFGLARSAWVAQPARRQQRPASSRREP